MSNHLRMEICGASPLRSPALYWQLITDGPAVVSHISNQGKCLIKCGLLKWKHQLLPERRLQLTRKYLRKLHYFSERVASLC